MYYQEKWINGRLCFKHSPKSEWQQFSLEQYRLKVIELSNQIKILKAEQLQNSVK